MVELRKSEQAEVPELQELFRLCFGDGPAYSDQYFQHYYRPEEFLVLREEGELRAMGGLLPLTLCEPDGRTVKAAYLYALATHPDHRGAGHARQLLDYAHFYLRGKRDCLLTVPARPDLHPFFQAAGFAECFPLLEGELIPRPPRTGTSARTVDAAAYDALRESLLAGRHHVSYGTLTGLQERLCAFGRGGLLALELDGRPGCAAVERWGETVMVKELLCPPDALEDGAALAAQAVLPGGRCVVRAPQRAPAPAGLSLRAFGMVRWYDPIAAARWEGAQAPYLGLAFD